jgi:DNA polymerase-3 subunit epsilon
MPWRRSPDDRRRAALSGATVGPLADYLGREFPAPDLALSQAPLLAIDLETTGLDPRRDRMLSVGFVPVDGLRVDLAGAGHLLIRDEAGVGQSATFHGLTDDVVAEGEPVDVVLASVLEALGGRALLAHFARIETGGAPRAGGRVGGGAGGGVRPPGGGAGTTWPSPVQGARRARRCPGVRRALPRAGRRARAAA